MPKQVVGGREKELPLIRAGLSNNLNFRSRLMVSPKGQFHYLRVTNQMSGFKRRAVACLVELCFAFHSPQELFAR